MLTHIKRLIPSRWIALLLAACLTACGGGGGGADGGAGGGAASPLTQDQTKNLCEYPRTGINPATKAAYLDRQGSLALEKSWVGAYSTDTYLWYNELPALDAASFATPVAYFDKLKTSATTPSGRLKDEFHFTYPSADYYALFTSGVSVDYGINWVSLARSVPRNLSVAAIDPNAPSSHQLIQRGMKLLTVDGYDFVNTVVPFEMNAINNALSPSTLNEQHTLKFQTNTGTLTVNVKATALNLTSVQNVKTVQTATGKVGYIQFDDHIASAQTPLVNAFTQLKNSGVTDLVLDLRYNGGGYLAMASQVAAMIAPATKTNNKVFEKLIFNDKNPFGYSDPSDATFFHGTTLNYGAGGGGLPLPNLGLNRVYVLTSGNTASASESIINGLRGVDVEVIVIGLATRGKPYGFLPQDNCGTTYFTIQFKGANNKGFGDYADGFAPHCQVADDLTKPMGDPTEKMFAQALYFQQYNRCNPLLASAVSKNVASSKSSDFDISDTRMSTLLRSSRIVSKPQP